MVVDGDEEAADAVEALSLLLFACSISTTFECDDFCAGGSMILEISTLEAREPSAGGLFGFRTEKKPVSSKYSKTKKLLFLLFFLLLLLSWVFFKEEEAVLVEDGEVDGEGGGGGEEFER